MGHGKLEVTPSPLESERFNLAIYRAISTQWPEDISEFHSIISDLDVDVIILRTKDLKPDFASLSSNFFAIAAGDLVYWASDRNPNFPTISDSMTYVPAAEVLEDFLTVIGDSFSDYVNHYSYNDLFSGFSPADAYLDWAQSRALSSDPNVLAGVLFQDGVAVGAISGVRTGDDIEVELAGIHSSFQGQGIYSKLIGGFWHALAVSQNSRLVISTQSENTSVQSAWRKLNLRQEFEVFTTHIVRKSLQVSGEG